MKYFVMMSGMVTMMKLANIFIINVQFTYQLGH